MSDIGNGGRVVAPGVMSGFAQLVTDGIMRGLQFQVARGWVNHYRPQTARQVIDQTLEFARSDDPDTPEGFHYSERFGERCEDRW